MVSYEIICFFNVTSKNEIVYYFQCTQVNRYLYHSAESPSAVGQAVTVARNVCGFADCGKFTGRHPATE